MSLTALELDLDVFSGPFDLLLALVLREEVDLLERQLADVVLAYLDHLERRGELDLEVATEFIVLVAALLELKSRLLLAGGGGAARADARPAAFPSPRRVPARAALARGWRALPRGAAAPRAAPRGSARARGLGGPRRAGRRDRQAAAPAPHD